MSFFPQLLFAAFAICLCSCDQQGQGVDFEKRSISYSLSQEPPTLSSIGPVSSVAFTVQAHVFEGLMRMDENKKLVGGVADSWEIKKDSALFKIRKNAKWSDGSAVTAHDFVYAWQIASSPKNEYNFIMAPIKNASAIAKGELSPDKLGIKALDDYTLSIDFAYPCAYFPTLTTFVTFMPMKQSFHEQFPGREYASDADKILYNGPFTISRWTKETQIELSKNIHYWNKDNIWLNEIKMPIIDQPRTVLNMFLSSDLCMASLDADNIKSALKNHIPIKAHNSGYVTYIEFNQRPGRLTTNKKLRQAIALVTSSSDLVNKVIGIPGNFPAQSLFPSWLPGAEQELYREHNFIPQETNYEKAKALIQQARQELKLEKIKLTYLVTDSPGSIKTAEYIQFQLKHRLDIDLAIDIQTFKLRIEKSNRGDFDLVGGGWGPDYYDPMTFGDLFTSWNNNNRGRFKNEAYDQLVREANESIDPKLRSLNFLKMHQILLEEVPIHPLVERGSVYISDPRLKNVLRVISGGDPNFIYARIDQ
ncbi:peptide ABC transporter substrate-binding protein [Lentisphaera profundi]|uniref:Peptide ABC transporter substrate-binding protein n=1 Tax=Lentisphaera profundi TaxID=1658616 RepID=A0ABY7VR07_9BACT|nr:peptide ABC transporter substrate-binding protein [Lentisphaera profundi]WDE96630.1 peptide ABC transporter substrate-binding protein [Lentisphaera profundi]